MALNQAAVEPHSQTAVEEAGTPRRRVVRITVATAVGLLIISAWLAWGAVQASAAGNVRIGYDAQPLRCEGSEVGTRPSLDNAEFLQPVAALTPGMRCELRIQVLNDGWAEITVREVGLLAIGDGNPLGLTMTGVSPNGAQEVRRPDQVDAAFFDIMGGLAVKPGESLAFTAMIEYSGSADMARCTSQGWNPPVVTVEALGAARSLQPADENVIWFQAGDLGECAE